MSLVEIVGNLTFLLGGTFVGAVITVVIKEVFFSKVDDWFTAILIWAPIGAIIGLIATWKFLGITISLSIS